MKDAIKATINIITALMVVFLTALFAVAGYTFDKHKELDIIDMCIVAISVIVLIALFCVCMFLLKKNIKRLEKMK